MRARPTGFSVSRDQQAARSLREETDTKGFCSLVVDEVMVVFRQYITALHRHDQLSILKYLKSNVLTEKKKINHRSQNRFCL